MTRPDILRRAGLLAAAVTLVLGLGLLSRAVWPLLPLAGAGTVAADYTEETSVSASVPPAVPEVRRPRTVAFPDGTRVSVDPVGITKSGAMAVPADPAHAGWWKPGPAPGDEGIAVLDGHSGWNGRPGAFAGLEGLKSGDLVRVEAVGGAAYVFAVWEEHRYPADADVPEVFTGREGSWLNLVTCVGTWDASKGTHSTRLVVTCKLVPELP